MAAMVYSSCRRKNHIRQDNPNTRPSCPSVLINSFSPSSDLVCSSFFLRPSFLLSSLFLLFFASCAIRPTSASPTNYVADQKAMNIEQAALDTFFPDAVSLPRSQEIKKKNEDLQSLSYAMQMFEDASIMMAGAIGMMPRGESKDGSLAVVSLAEQLGDAAARAADMIMDDITIPEEKIFPSTIRPSGSFGERMLQQEANNATLDNVAPYRIIGGTNADKSRFRFVASLRDLNGNHFCGGTLLSDRVVLTAGHCLDQTDLNLRYPIVHLGQYYMTKPEANADIQIRRCVTTIINPGWSFNTGANDLSLCVLNASVTGLPYSTIAPTSLGLRTADQLTVLGWGSTVEGGSNVETLQEVNVWPVELASCNATYSGIVRQTNICAGKPLGGADACQGDSGGPLMALLGTNGTGDDDFQVGLVSWGKGCGQAGEPGVYTNVADYRGWINAMVKAQTGSFIKRVNSDELLAVHEGIAKAQSDVDNFLSGAESIGQALNNSNSSSSNSSSDAGIATSLDSITIATTATTESTSVALRSNATAEVAAPTFVSPFVLSKMLLQRGYGSCQVDPQTVLLTTAMVEEVFGVKVVATSQDGLGSTTNNNDISNSNNNSSSSSSNSSNNNSSNSNSNQLSLSNNISDGNQTTTNNSTPSSPNGLNSNGSVTALIGPVPSSDASSLSSSSSPSLTPASTTTTPVLTGLSDGGNAWLSSLVDWSLVVENGEDVDASGAIVLANDSLVTPLAQIFQCISGSSSLLPSSASTNANVVTSTSDRSSVTTQTSTSDALSPTSSLCDCTIDGRSGNVNTRLIGCRQHALLTGDRSYYCMVVGGTACPSATASTLYSGAAWKTCSTLLSSSSLAAAPAITTTSPITTTSSTGMLGSGNLLQNTLIGQLLSGSSSSSSSSSTSSTATRSGLGSRLLGERMLRH